MTNVNAYAANIITSSLNFARVQTRPETQSQRSSASDDGFSAANCATRCIEKGEKPITGGLDLSAAVAIELTANVMIVTVEDLTPAAISDC